MTEAILNMCQKLVSDDKIGVLPKSINFWQGESMPRHPRVHAEGLLYHMKARGNDGQKIFLSQSDYQALIEALRTVHRPRVIHVTGFCRACGI